MTDQPDIAERALARRRREDGAVALPLLGCLLLVSPLLDLFTHGETVMGLPAAYIYVFAVWLGLIVVAARLAFALVAAEDGG